MLPDKNQTPLNDDQYRLYQQLASCLTPEQKAWLGGYLTANTAGNLQTSPNAAAVGDADITILVGSQTGNCDELSQRAAQIAASKGLSAAVKKMGAFKLPQLKKEKFLLVLISTQGEGDPPDNAKEIYEFLYSKKAPKLNGLQFSVLGLGDSSYEFFCKTGKDFDQRLEELGGERLHPRVDCDVDYDEAADEWLESVFSVLSTKVEKSAAISAASSFAPAAASQYSRKNPFPSMVLDDIILNGRGTDKETHHIELSLEDSGLTYEPGDSIGIYPTNAPDVVDDLIKALHFKPDDKVTYSKEEHSLAEALLEHYEATIITRPVIQKYADLVKNKQLSELLSDDQKDKLNEYLYGRELIDLVTDFPSRDLTPQAFTDCLRKLPPRLYSIASSLKAHPDEVHLTVAAVRYNSFGRDRKGVCSTYLADRISDDTKIPIYVDHNSHFKLPADPSVPIIMIGPGTGIAPFRAFVEEREEIGANGKNWLFFGDQHFMTDFLYQAEWLRFLKDGILTRMDVAFSRDQDHKVYVQHRLRENSKDLYSWLQDGAQLYVCGDEKRMAHDVHDALLDIIAKESGGDKDSAEAYMNAMQKENRYQRDVY